MDHVTDKMDHVTVKTGSADKTNSPPPTLLKDAQPPRAPPWEVLRTDLYNAKFEPFDFDNGKSLLNGKINNRKFSIKVAHGKQPWPYQTSWEVDMNIADYAELCNDVEGNAYNAYGIGKWS